jgi:SAM-dependent methyltransferase
MGGGSGAIGEGSCIADSGIVLQASGARMTLLDDDGADESNKLRGGGAPITARSEWVPHIDFVDVKALVGPHQARRPYAPALAELTSLAISLSKQLSAGITDVQLPHLKKYKAWLDQQQALSNFDTLKLAGRINSLVRQQAKSPAAPVAAAISRVSANIVTILSSEKGAFEILNADGTLNKINAFMKESCSSSVSSNFIQSFALSNPCLRVLELGATYGAATEGILKNLKHPNGQLLYSQYVCADVSMGMVNVAKERFKGIANLEFALLDVSKDLSTQGFDDDNKKFDLIIATDVLHATPRLQTSLRNVHKLLSPNGRLLIQEPVPGSAWRKQVLGVLPGWWCGIEDGNEREEEPYISLTRWKEELVATGFESPDAVEQENFTVAMIAKPRGDKEATSSKRITLLCSNISTPDSPLAKELEARGYSISRCTVEMVSPHGEDIVALLDLDEKPFFENINEATFEKFKSFVADAHKSESGIL